DQHADEERQGADSIQLNTSRPHASAPRFLLLATPIRRRWRCCFRCGEYCRTMAEKLSLRVAYECDAGHTKARYLEWLAETKIGELRASCPVASARSRFAALTIGNLAR